MSAKREFKEGFCNLEECGKRFLKKPADKEFCRKRCAYRFHNQKRGRVTMQTAQRFIREHCITIAEAELLGAGTRSEIRARIRRKELPVIRLFGRVLLNKNDVARKTQ